ANFATVPKNTQVAHEKAEERWLHQGNSADTTRCSGDPLNRVEITFLVEKHTGRPGKGRRKVTASG
ncbi:hypothetical protein, partial [Escherichia coli]|uniref:hypothetical protein n=1 Tax=Escherichia coli TaxID=562 RepID=UPI001B8D04C5